MKLFDEGGHLTDEGLRGLTLSELDEEQRMEAAEHLDFCDRCVERYALALTDETMLEPAVPAAPVVMDRIRFQKRKMVFGKFARVAIAAAMALVVWNGMLLSGSGLLAKSASWVNHLPDSDSSFSQTVKGFGWRMDQLMNGLNSWLNSGVQGHPEHNS